MPDKHPDPREWGGPGSSEQNAKTPAPQPHDPRPPGTPTNTPQSDVSGGGGVRDTHHSHEPKLKS